MTIYRLPIESVFSLSRLIILKSKSFSPAYSEILKNYKDFNHHFFNIRGYYPFVLVDKNDIIFFFTDSRNTDINYDIISLPNSVKLILKS